MSKNETTAATNRIEGLMAEMGTVSLKALAGVFELNPIRLYSVAKQPKEGVVYDAKVFNWDAIERFIERRLDADKGIATLEEVLQAALVIEAELKSSDGRRTSTRGEGGSYGKKIEVDGKMVAERRFANFEMANGQFVALKKDPEVYAIVMQTLSHTVLRPVASAAAGPEFDFKGNDVTVISNGMMNFKGVGPSALEDALKDRFSGKYAQELADEAAKAAADAAEKASAKTTPAAE